MTPALLVNAVGSTPAPEQESVTSLVDPRMIDDTGCWLLESWQWRLQFKRPSRLVGPSRVGEFMSAVTSIILTQ